MKTLCKVLFKTGLLLAILLFVGEAAAENLIVPASGTTVTSSVLEAGKEYQIRAEGTYIYSWANLPADAEWHLRYGATNWEEDYWDSGSGIYHYSELDLLVNNTEYDWLGTTDGTNFAPHTYSPLHTYMIDSFVGTGQAISFRIQDIDASDNSGYLNVSITPEPATLFLLTLGGLLLRRKKCL
ncbi:MAG: PEP-CTERM sorting domain-containing protein [Sedimentisphaerales bacterium]|jgi:hypothetical protein